jgi:hypothetical protein
MIKQNLTSASVELFRRTPDERFGTLQQLWEHCHREHTSSRDLWTPPQELRPTPSDGRLDLGVATEGEFKLNSWSFGQLCQLAGLNKDTVNRLQPATAARVFEETLPSGNKPLQVYTRGEMTRSIHGAAYTRLPNVELLTMLREFASGFEPPQEAGPSGGSGGTGLYCGEQDMFVFMIDPLGWIEIEGEAFAPGFFLWNSEVGRRSVGVQTFWFQAVCQNHIVWDAVEVIDFSRKHTASVGEAVSEIRGLIERLVDKRDARRDSFARVVRKAMEASLGSDADEVAQVLHKHGVTRSLAKQALEVARQNGRFTIFSVVDALTRVTGRYAHVGDRTEVEVTASRLLALAV